MEKVTIKNLIDFRRRNERTRITFVKNLNKDKIKEGSSGGDYWISGLSAITNAFKYDNIGFLQEKIDLLREKIKYANARIVRDQFQRNIDILVNFQDFDFQHLKPKSDLTFLKQPKNKSILTIKDYPIEAKPSQVFSFSEDKSEEVGGVWFVSKLNGFKKNELGMFADIMFRYLDKHHSQNFYVNPDYCTAVDLFTGQVTNYSSILNGDIPILIDATIEEMKNTK